MPPINDSSAIVRRITDHFAAMGWSPLLQLKVNGLRMLSVEALQDVLRRIRTARDRFEAIDVVLAAIAPVEDLAPPSATVNAPLS